MGGGRSAEDLFVCLLILLFMLFITVVLISRGFNENSFAAHKLGPSIMHTQSYELLGSMVLKDCCILISKKSLHKKIPDIRPKAYN